jgi:tetratricopeptide (TPR) repeat protein
MELKSSSFVQKDWVQMRDGWKRFTNSEPVRLKIKNKKNIAAAFALAQKSIGDVNHRARILWQIVTLAPQIDATDEALSAIKLLRESGQIVIGQDLIQSAFARILYQKGEIDQALAAYAEIPKSSSLWVESVEEKAWAYLRKNDSDKALGQTITLLSPALAPLVGPESFYLANLMALKICDYPRIFKNSDLFKARHKDRLNGLIELSQNGTSKNLPAAMDRLDAKGITVEAAGPLVGSFPRATFRDQRFVTLMSARRQLQSEITKAHKVGALGDFGTKIVQLQPKLDQLKQLALLRLRTLARNELNEYQHNLSKMHVIEAEVMQRLAVDESLKGKRDKIAKAKDDGEVMVFPYDSDEVWLDELDNYKAQVKNCPQLKEASL